MRVNPHRHESIRRQHHTEIVGIDRGVLPEFVDEAEVPDVAAYCVARVIVLGVEVRPRLEVCVMNNRNVEIGPRRAVDRLLAQPGLPDLNGLDVSILGQPDRRVAKSACQSAANAGTAITGVDRTRSGIPKLHSPPSANLSGGGMSPGSPGGAPLSAHLAIVAISSSLRERVIPVALPGSDVPLDEPRRHLAHRGPELDRSRPRSRFLVRHQRHRCHPTRSMAGLARALEDGGNVLGERWLPAKRGLPGCQRVRGRQNAERCDDRRESPDRSMNVRSCAHCSPPPMIRLADAAPQ